MSSLNQLWPIPSLVRTARMTLLTCLTAGVATAAHANLDYTVGFVGDISGISDLMSPIVQHVGAALADWGQHLVGSAKIDVEVQLTDSVVAAAASSRASAYVGEQAGMKIYGSGMAFKINQGVDVNGDTPDIEILLNPTYLRNELWFDPAPFSRQALVPLDKVDAMSLFIHEVGHALAFNGWGDHFDGTLPADYASTWDIHTVFDAGDLYFTGPRAMQMYGGAVPITLGNNYHIGNANGPGADLLPDIMNGVAFFHGQRYDISSMDIAMLQDMGVLVQAVPEVETVWLMAYGLAAMAATMRLRRRLIPARRDCQ
ncbi:MAG: hypothetical protein ACM3VZ_10725 [Acidobacteriota bacterium]